MIDVLDPGFLTTVQDGGRHGWARFGVPPSGPVDLFAFRAANLLVSNAPGAAGLEVTLAGPTLRFLRDALVAVCGAAFELWVGRLPVPTWHALYVRAGQVVRFGARHSGARAYLACDGGIALPHFLGSQSTYVKGGFGGLEGRALRQGDRLPLGSPLRRPFAGAGRAYAWAGRPAYAESPPTLRVVVGPQTEHFAPEGLDTFLEGGYQLTPASDRMGVRLSGPAIAYAGDAGIPSDGVVMGCVQVPPDGQPIVMLADHQTTGGYAKIATVIRADLPLLAQCLPGDGVRFRAVTLAAAREALLEQEKTPA